jgi:RHH-type proline utilization regulon transcriptional repressor/proline dehydrogenase/delta 1-pyrroline-5-carboxylate dehydrogenase
LRKPLPNHQVVPGTDVEAGEIQQALNILKKPNRDAIETYDLPGPTGESNRLSMYAKGVILCLGPTVGDAVMQIKIAKSMGCSALSIVPGDKFSGNISGFLNRDILSQLSGIDAVALWSTVDDLKLARRALASRSGPIVPLFATKEMKDLCVHERHICIDTTAAGGNASLLAAQ